ncbi:MAG: prephenate dehydratase [Verrucomicrobiota bacterium]
MLQQIRKKIDAIDEKLVKLLNDRMRLSEEVGNVKRSTGQSVFAPGREEMLLQRLEELNDGSMSTVELRAIYSEVISISRSRQKELRFAYLGPEGSYCHQAAVKRFGNFDRFAACGNIQEIFDAVASEEVDAGIVPIENSTEGGVNATHDALIHTDLKICGEIFLPIRHVLCAANKDNKINVIYSHPQAFGQCRKWLGRHHSSVKLVEMASTSLGAKRAKEEKHAAAISSELSVELYGLDIIQKNIQDSTKNLTRFLIIGHQNSSQTKRDKTSLLFSVRHEIGSLSKVLGIFSKEKLNLEKIESRPSKDREWEYLFFVDIKGHCEDPLIAKALEKVSRKTHWLKILGSYPMVNKHV